MKARFQMALPSFSSVLLSSSTIFINPFFVFLLKNVLILDGGGRIETGTRLAGIEFAVTYDACLGIDLMQQREDLIQDDHLLGSAIVLVLVLGTARVATFVADPDTEGIVALDMAPSLADRSTIIQTTIPPHI